MFFKQRSFRIFSVSLTILSVLSPIRAVSVQERYGAGCAYIAPTIYCYGGEVNSGSNYTTLSTSIFNTISLNEDMTVDAMQEKWDYLQREHPGPLSYFQMVAVPNQNAILIDGGMVYEDRGQGKDYYPPEHITMIYDIGTENWANDIIQDHPALYTHTATLGPDDMIFIWGGKNVPSSTANSGNAPVEFPSNMAGYDLKNRRWSSMSSPEFLSTNRGRAASALGKDGLSIYYVGGLIPVLEGNGTDYHEISAPMNQIIIFNTSNFQWSTRNTAGDIVPTTRSGHTLHLNPATNDLIMFGGYDPFGSTSNWNRGDYCYQLNTETMEWNRTDIGSDEGASHTLEGGINYHSGVVVEKYLFIIFGSLPGEIPTNEIRVLDMERMSWVSQFVAPKQSSGTSTGTIVGAVVGSVGGVALIGAIVVFFLLRRRRQARLSAKDENETHTEAGDARNQFYPNSTATRPLSPFNANNSTQGGSTTEVPHSSDSDDRTRKSMSYFYGIEKPDAIVSEETSGNPRRIVMTPVNSGNL
ncbi:hypothetical protein BJV82DRAFT_636237 [Fennellomyces sp. T-0311]|nr:hypothetical protein BJV82DRAFT_636237 [Fennellomyces sp. T-0311]